MTNNRDYRIDIVRALCVLEIIAFWHMMDNLPSGNGLTGFALSLGKMSTHTSLAAFGFISGLCLSKYKFENKRDVWYFYKKRLIRFYPLLLLSSLSLLIAGFVLHRPWFTGFGQFVSTITGVNIFSPPLAFTLWYFSMIMFFYIITPLILSMKLRCKKILVAITILLVVLLLDVLFMNVDRVFYLYYPFYALGLIVPSESLTYIYKRKIVVSFMSIACFCSMAFVAKNALGYFVNGGIYAAMISGILCLLSIAAFVNNYSNNVTRYISVISYTSMSAYLFHRQIYFIIGYLIGDANKDLNIYTALLIAVPVIFVVSYTIQKAYDVIVAKLHLDVRY